MNVPDVNLLLYAHIEAFAEHAKARGWWDALLNGRTEIGVAGPVLFGFVRLVTNRSLFEPPTSVEIALSRVESWLAGWRVPTSVFCHLARATPRSPFGFSTTSTSGASPSCAG